MSSISSARKGRPNRSKDSDYLDISADFEMTIRNWRLAERMEFEPDTFALEIRCLAGDVEEDPIGLNPFFVIDSRIRRAPIGVYKVSLVSENRGVVVSRYIAIPDDAEGSVDLLGCRDASQDEISEALAWQPEPEPEPLPVAPAPTFTRIPRTEGDSASYLGFEVPDGRDIQLPDGWQARAFHLASPHIVGAISVVSELEIRLFDALGHCLLRTETAKLSKVKFNQLRLEAGDYLLTFYVKQSHVEVAGFEPAPILDDVLRAPKGNTFGQLTVPLFKFEA